ncbi:hypothetical protein HYFRA_00003863 [Hymenoscyphus fraxineus]|uniref:Spt20-like SEP domain-containing protein n=1 Tax=Hymenoscyphus fraxineus TaxID=746836 RepID=A0A9N9L2P7_9HELO|nr:hypothetical protein HYFRA_00003863 [Hymenoscyphus fraxineus]
MAPSATSTQSLSSKAKRPIPPGIQTNGIHSSTSSPSPSMSAGRLPNSGKLPNSATGNGVGAMSAGSRAIARARRDGSAQLLGRGQRNSSAGLRSASLMGDSAAPQIAEPTPYVKSDEYILKRYRNSKPSLIVHLHPTHFRFDEQEGSFSYKSPMRILIEHLRTRTVPHDLVEFFTDMPFYEGCMIVQIHDHKSIAPSQGPAQAKSGVGKTVPFSVHNYNAYLTPSSYVPFPSQQNHTSSKGRNTSDTDDGKSKQEQKDKENMPAPSLPGDASRGKGTNLPKKPKVSTIVLRPTPLSNHVDLAVKAAESISSEGRRDSRADAGPLSATVPPTPSTAISPTPQTAMPPPAKKLKKNKTDLDIGSIYWAESQIALATNAPLFLEPVNSAGEAAALLSALEHPMHSAKPPSPKTRKRTVAEMAADEALAAERERYMLIMDERLSSNAANAQGGGNPADGDGQAGGASFEPRFERFKTLENIRNQHEENKKAEKLLQQENERKQTQERDRERLRIESEKKELFQDKQRQVAAARQQQQEHQRQMAAHARSQQNMAQMQAQQNQHGHPQGNNVVSNGMQAQPQRFHQQQVSQAQASSPIIRTGTPQSQSSPVVNAMGGGPMQQSNSSMGGSPPRPGSVVHQNPQMGVPTSHAMQAQRSQQSHAGTPRIPNTTPQIQQTPLNRQMSQTPRMSQGSPVQGPIAHAPNMPMMVNNLTPAQQQQLQAQQRMQMMRQQQQMAGMANGQGLSPQQQQMMHAQMLRQQQQQQQGMGMVANGQLPQGYTAQMAAQMAAQGRGMPQNMNQNFMNGSPGVPASIQMQMHMQQQQQQQAQAVQMRNAQMVQAQVQAQAQAQAHAQNQARQGVPGVGGIPPAAIQMEIRNRATRFYNEKLPQLQNQHPNGIPPEVDQAFRMKCQRDAHLMVQGIIQNKQAAMQQHQQMLAQQHGLQHGMNGMPNGMGM